MDGNKDESERCFKLAQEHRSKKSFAKALRFAQKANRLYPSQRAEDLISEVEALLGNPSENEQYRESNFTEDFVETETTNDSSARHSVKRTVDFYKNCKDYYEILGVTKSSSESDIKRNYRKLALQFHPDKNKATGSAEAFKAIGNAFAILSDPEKRRRYDQAEMQPPEYRHRRNGYNHDYTRGFDEDFNAEEIFNVFFGGGFPTRNVYVYRNNHNTYQRATNHEARDTPGFNVLLQIMPILLFICISLLSTFVPDNPYSLSRSTKYPYQRYTENFKVPYYVKEHFERDYKGNIRQIESHVEDTFISNLQTSCFKEKNYKKNMIYRARFMQDLNLEDKALKLATPSCERLNEFNQLYYANN